MGSYANRIYVFAKSFEYWKKWITGKATKIIKRLTYCSRNGSGRRGTGLGNVKKVEPKHLMAECKT